jgi:plasmid stabilization system protein ParE
MAFKVLYHEDALTDLEDIFDWSRQRHPNTTEQFADALFNHLDSLQAFPYMGALVKGHPNVRRLLHSPLFVYYLVDVNRGRIEILHFWHVSRQAPML